MERGKERKGEELINATENIVFFARQISGLRNRLAPSSIFNTYVIALDVVEKNFLKLSEPKGSSGGRNYDNMY